MKFGPVVLDDAAGAVLAHTTRVGEVTLKKGHVFTPANIDALRAAGFTEIIAARIEPGDVAENAAAAEIARAIAGSGVIVTPARTGRCNIEATEAGLIHVDAACIDAINGVSEQVTIATLPDMDAARAGQIVATVKIIPFAVDAVVMAKVTAFARPALRLAPFRPLRTAIISTLAPELKASVVQSTEEFTARRVADLKGTVVACERVAHAVTDLTAAIRNVHAAGAEQILIAGAFATVDRNDIAPAAVVAAGGVIDHFGMPVDPGNLLVLARIDKIPVLVLPGCARSPKLNGVDWVMRRVAAGITIDARAIMSMGVGGLLIDTPVRPLPRAEAVEPTRVQDGPIAAIVLAAGRSTRMGPRNKLLMPLGGKPLIRRTVGTVLAAKPAVVIVVTGHERAAVEEALAGLPVTFRHNPRYAEGLSTSLQVGLGALGDAVGALICLGDMPGLASGHLQKLMAAFAPDQGRAIVVPVHDGKRGNPVLWAKRFFVDMAALAGDVGARHLIGANESLVYEVEFGDTAVLTDIDTPEAWSAYADRDAG